VRVGPDVDADDRLAKVAKRVKAGVAELEAELVFTLGVESAVAFEAGGIVRALTLFAGVNFGMNFKFEHKLPWQGMGTNYAKLRHRDALNRHNLQRALRNNG